jgi:cysteinyl-tRNA synthetase
MKLHNTLTGRKEAFTPRRAGHVGMYACGVTLYDECHLGHARSALVFEVLRRYLQFKGFTVRFVRNFTDIDDKIINRATQETVPWQDIVERYLRAYRRDMGRLRIPPADIEPKATEHIADIVSIIGTLIEKGHAYRLNGDVYFQVETYPAYGRLSKRKPEDLLAGARVEVNERKRNPMDFALWKASKPGEPAWPSPWGMGRPGWHIECSAMSIRHLGETFDIHGGGMDLIFPHHENEIAQSCAATDKEFAVYWVHNGFVEINKEKMSKSLGNFFTIREVFEKAEAWGWEEKITAEALRYYLLSTHYRSPLEFSDQGLHEAKRALDNLYGLLLRLEEPATGPPSADRHLDEALTEARRAFTEMMDDDLNTPAVIAEFQRLRANVNRSLEGGMTPVAAKNVVQAYRSLGDVLGLLQLPPGDWLFAKPGGHDAAQPKPAPISEPEIHRLLAVREQARRNKDFARADEIRKQLAVQGIVIEDRPDGTTRWKR